MGIYDENHYAVRRFKKTDYLKDEFRSWIGMFHAH